jgi:hypothetical protein
MTNHLSNLAKPKGCFLMCLSLLHSHHYLTAQGRRRELPSSLKAREVFDIYHRRVLNNYDRPKLSPNIR